MKAASGSNIVAGNDDWSRAMSDVVETPCHAGPANCRRDVGGWLSARGREPDCPAHAWLRSNVADHLASRRRPFDIREAVSLAVQAASCRLAIAPTVQAGRISPLVARGDERLVTRAIEALILSLTCDLPAASAIACRLDLRGCHAVLDVRVGHSHRHGPLQHATRCRIPPIPETGKASAACSGMSPTLARLALEAHGGGVRAGIGTPGSTGLEILLPLERADCCDIAVAGRLLESPPIGERYQTEKISLFQFGPAIDEAFDAG